MYFPTAEACNVELLRQALLVDGGDAIDGLNDDEDSALHIVC